ncbi:cap-specific mRNA (nucleoside-2'-O-)-methyltransferase 1 [Angomonas deanei]|nr:cap-specific mRNA (nucleoside-2'-O-)-methyltransferase 1 [Angomonas deanei]|eukprot:EPY40696.1 cap-specific mRNA (nucleoside-2'-O-)-methyltransferase 1 [Angomonas deanei]
MSEETVTDKTVEFLVRRDESVPPPNLLDLVPPKSGDYNRIHWREAFDETQKDLRESVWECKSNLDPLTEKQYLGIRNKLFPSARSGQQSRYFFNRAGFKLMESMEATGVWVQLKRITTKHKKHGRRVTFVDVCGGPGSFSQALFSLAKKQDFVLKGYGITLAGVKGLDWYPDLKKSGFVATYGVDGTGDVFKLMNLEALATITKTENVLLVVADGGFTVERDVANYQETISARITYGQWLSALKLLRPGGCFVLKLFDTFSPNTRAFLYLSTFIFEKVHIVKPLHSRVVNSERYLVCKGFIGVPEGWMTYLDDYYDRGFVDNDHSPLLLPLEVMARDTVFMSGIEEMNETIAANQKIALSMIVKAAEAGETGEVPAEEDEQENPSGANKRSRPDDDE